MSSIPTDNEFLRMVYYFYETKGDPTRYSSWDEDRFEALRPVEHGAWRRYVLENETCRRLMTEMHYQVEED